MSISDFIATQQATGAMAMTFFYPCLYMWLNVFQERGLIYKVRGAMETLACFQLSFGMFLTCPLYSPYHMHPISVNCLCIFGLLHYRLILQFCAARHFWRCSFFICMGCLFYVATFLITVISEFSSVMEQDVPWLFYVCEAAGLSSMAVFPMLWFVAGEQPQRDEKGTSHHCESVSEMSSEYYI
jgi:hypothetical protein